MAGAAPFGEDLTVVVVGGEERQPVSNPLEPVRHYKYGFKLLYEITVVRVPVKVRKTRSLKLERGRAARGRNSTLQRQ